MKYYESIDDLNLYETACFDFVWNDDVGMYERRIGKAIISGITFLLGIVILLVVASIAV